jgi:hypothetical protein
LLNQRKLQEHEDEKLKYLTPNNKDTVHILNKDGNNSIMLKQYPIVKSVEKGEVTLQEETDQSYSFVD